VKARWYIATHYTYRYYSHYYTLPVWKPGGNRKVASV